MALPRRTLQTLIQDASSAVIDMEIWRTSVCFFNTQSGRSTYLLAPSWSAATENRVLLVRGKTSRRQSLGNRWFSFSEWRGCWNPAPNLLRPLSVGQIPDYIRDKSVRYDSVDLMWITHNDLSWCSKRLWVQAYSQHFNLIDERETYLIGLSY